MALFSSDHLLRAFLLAHLQKGVLGEIQHVRFGRMGAPGQVRAACSRAATRDVAFDATDSAHKPTME